MFFVVVLNVLSYKDKNTDLYVCYCYENDIVGAGQRLRDAIGDLENYLEALKVFPRPIKKRREIVDMFASLFFEGAKPPYTRTTQSGHELHFYRFSKVPSFGIKARDVYDEIERAIEQKILEQRSARPPLNFDEIPF